MPDTIISVSIKDRYALTEGNPVLVCGNSDYFIKFSFDEEWDAYEAKTARFIYTRAGKVRYQDVVFTGDTVQVPVLSMVQAVQVGVFAGNLRTTTPARIPCRFSVRCGTGEPEEPTPSQYDQIMALLEHNGEGKLDKNQGAKNAGKTLVIGEDGNVIPGKVKSDVELDTTLTQSGKAADAKAVGDKIAEKIPVPATASVGQTIKVSAVDENGKPTAWEAADFPEGGGGSSGSEWTKLGDVTVSGTYEFNILAIDGGVITLDTNAEWYSYMNGNRNVIVHAIDISATNVYSHLLKLRPKDYSAGTFDVYNMDDVKQSSVAFNTTQYKISVQNINKVVMTGIPQYDKYKMRAFFPVIHPHGLRPIFGCNVSRLGFGESDPTGHGPSIFEKELFTFPYNPNYMVEKASITFGVLYPVDPDTMHNAVTIVKAGENQTRPKNDTIEFNPYFCPFVNGTRFEVWGANDV